EEVERSEDGVRVGERPEALGRERAGELAAHGAIEAALIGRVVVDEDEAAEAHEAAQADDLALRERLEGLVAGPVEEGRLEDGGMVGARAAGLERDVEAGALSDLPAEAARRGRPRARLAPGVGDGAHLEEGRLAERARGLWRERGAHERGRVRDRDAGHRAPRRG